MYSHNCIIYNLFPWTLYPFLLCTKQYCEIYVFVFEFDQLEEVSISILCLQMSQTNNLAKNKNLEKIIILKQS